MTPKPALQHLATIVTDSAGVSIMPSTQQTNAELRLAAAVFGDGLAALNSEGAIVKEQAREWVRSDDDSWLFSFANLCSILKLDVEATRTALLKPRAPVVVDLRPAMKNPPRPTVRKSRKKPHLSRAVG